MRPETIGRMNKLTEKITDKLRKLLEFIKSRLDNESFIKIGIIEASWPSVEQSYVADSLHQTGRKIASFYKATEGINVVNQDIADALVLNGTLVNLTSAWFKLKARFEKIDASIAMSDPCILTEQNKTTNDGSQEEKSAPTLSSSSTTSN